MRDEEEYSDFSNVEKQRNFLAAEEFPEGPTGSPINVNKPVENKSTSWKEGQQFYSNFTYENRSLHAGRPRKYPGAHPTHDEQSTNEE